ncbi:quinol monooxygenase YgiN [Bradyrhizobium sp. USDA 4011]
MIQGIVVIVTKPGMRAEVLDIFQRNVPAVHAEAGCIEYTAFTDLKDYGPPQTAYGDDTFIIVEKWESVAALKAHARSPHMAAYAERVKNKLASRTVHLLQPVSR